MIEKIENWRRRTIREKATAMGDLIDLSMMFPKEAVPNYSYPVFCSAAVWREIQETALPPYDLDAVVWDVLYMSLSNRKQDLFSVILPSEEERFPDFHWFGKIITTDIDDPHSTLAFIVALDD